MFRVLKDLFYERACSVELELLLTMIEVFFSCLVWLRLAVVAVISRAIIPDIKKRHQF